MELLKKNIHMNKLKCQSNVQLTLDDDFNVPDIKPDVGNIVKEQGNIIISELKAMDGKIMVKGSLDFSLLYVSEDDARPIHNMTGQLDFEETVNMDKACSDDSIVCKWELEDLSTSLINSRKFSVRAIVSFYYMAEEIYDEETAVEIEGEDHILCQKKDIDITQLVLNKKDTFRVKDEIVLPSGKSNIAELLYSETILQELETRLIEDGIHISGDILLFILYTGEEEEGRVFYSTHQIPFSGTVSCNGCNESMVADIETSIHSKDIQVKPDDDGEQRILDLEVVLELNMKVYEEENFEIINDVYSTKMELLPDRKKAYYEKLLMKNNSKVRISERMPVRGDQGRVLQICNATGNVRIDEEMLVDNGIQVEGVVEVQMLYITDEDDRPLGAEKGVVPFSQLIEAKGISEKSIYRLRPALEQINVMMPSGEEAEVKAVIGMDVIVFDKIEEPIITGVTEQAPDLEKLQAMPSIVGYIVKEGDSLWDIAKKFYTTEESVMNLNRMENSKVKKGDKLLLMKKVDGIL